MNEHVRGDVNGVVYKDRLDARIIHKVRLDARVAKPEPPQKGQRKPLGLAPVTDELSPVSALDGLPAEVLASPATVQDVLTALDSAIAIRSDLDQPLRVRLSRLESANGELRAELAASKADVTTLQASLAKTQATVKALRLALPDKAELKAQVAAEFKAQFAAMHAERIARRAEQKAGK